MNILVATLGRSWQVIPEVFGFTNPGTLDLYRESPVAQALEEARKRHGIAPVDRIWVVATEDAVRRSGESLRKWGEALGLELSIWWPGGMKDIRSEEDSRCMGALIHRLVFHAHRQAQGGQVILSLAGGRKTMSADLQQAGGLFGFHAMLHVINRIPDEEIREIKLGVGDFLSPLQGRAAEAFLPVVLSGIQPPSDAVLAEKESLEAQAGPLPPLGPVDRDAGFLDCIEAIRSRADSLLANFRLQIAREDAGGNFRALYALPARKVQALRETHLSEADLEWLTALPKAELHCHLGGILSVPGMIRVAAVEEGRVLEQRRRVPAFDADLRRLEALAAGEDLEGIGAFLEGGFRGLRGRWNVPQPLGVCGFLLAFRGREGLLERLIYRDLLDPARFCGIGIDAYEALGDLQGSGLLQSRATLQGAVEELASLCRRDGIRYLELRCSPLNYTRGGLGPKAVVETLLDAIEGVGHCDLRLIFIASRHGEPGRIAEHVKLAVELLDDERFARRFAGFDLAGAEHAGNPAAFRESFRPLHERVVRLTIHAGEGAPVRNVWEAVYELNADRIGHGLTLREEPELLGRFRDRHIAVEMCPSSNFQIVGFDDPLLGVEGKGPYPLKDYLEAGLRVTVNTDDPGISRTDLPREYLRAAAMTPGGLSRWEALRLVRNGFRAAFCAPESRRRHLLEAEEAILRRLGEEG